jgi:hypothetical protein
MTATNDRESHEIESPDARRRQIRVMQVLFAGAATIATLALFNAARPGDAENVVASGPVHLVDAQFLQTPPSVGGAGGFATDDNDPTDIANQDAQQTAQTDIDLGDQETQQAEQQGADTQESVLGPTLTGLP